MGWFRCCWGGGEPGIFRYGGVGESTGGLVFRACFGGLYGSGSDYCGGRNLIMCCKPWREAPRSDMRKSTGKLALSVVNLGPLELFVGDPLAVCFGHGLEVAFPSVAPGVAPFVGFVVVPSVCPMEGDSASFDALGGVFLVDMAVDDGSMLSGVYVHPPDVWGVRYDDVVKDPAHLENADQVLVLVAHAVAAEHEVAAFIQ